jgi:hypothetical protein
MNAQQTAYAIAKTQYDAAHKAAFDYTTALYEDPDITDDELMAGELEAEDKFGVNEAHAILKTAEAALLEWSMNKAMQVAYLEDKAAVAIAYKAAETSATTRHKILEAAMKLS